MNTITTKINLDTSEPSALCSVIFRFQVQKNEQTSVTNNVVTK